MTIGLVELCKEEGAQVDRTGTGDSLQAGDLRDVSSSHDVVQLGAHPLVLDSRAVFAQYEFLRGGSELGETGDRQVLVVEVGVVAESLFGLWVRFISLWSIAREEGAMGLPRQYTHQLDNRQNPRLRVVISVGSNAQIDLLGVFIATEGRHQPEQRVFRRLGDDIRVESGSSHWVEVGGYLCESCLCGGLGRSRERGGQWLKDR